MADTLDGLPPSPDLVPQRRLVPSERQRRLGDVAQGPDGPAPYTPRPRGPRLGVLRRFGRDINPRNLGGPKLPVMVLASSALIAQWDDQALAILLPEMRTDFGFSLAFLVTLGAVMQFFSVLLAPAMGYLADRVKRVRMMQLGGVLANVAPIVQGAASGLPQLVAGRALGGAGGAIRQPASFPVVSDYYPLTSRARVFALLAFAGGLGGIAGPTIAGRLAEAYGWRTAVIGLGILATLVTLGLFLIKEPARGYQERRAMGASPEEARREQRPVSWAEAWRAAHSVTTVRRIWYATPFLQVASTGIGLFLVQYYADQFGLGPQQRGYISSALAAVALVGIVIAAPVSDRLLAFRPGRVMVAFGALILLQAVSILVLVVSHNLWLSVIVSLPLGIAGTAILPAQFTLLSLTIPPRIRGLGLQTIAPWQLMGLTGTFFIARVADEWGIRQGMLAFLPLLTIGAIILMSSSTGVDRDIRAATAASMAEQEARRSQARGRRKLLVCRDVDVSYDGVQVVFKVDFDVEQGELVVLLGTNGAGKSTLLRAIAGVQEASNGAIFLDGQDITHVPAHENAREGITIVPGGQGVFPELTVKENLRTAAWLHRDDDTFVREATARALRLFPVLRERMSQPAGTLSAGEQQMLTLAQAFLSRPRLLMIDELSLGLAPVVVNSLLDTLQQINAQGTTVILVEQSVNAALRVARRAVFMEKGEIRFDGHTEELLRRPDLVRSIFFGGAASAAARVGVPRLPSPRAERLLEAADINVRFGGVQALAGAGLVVGAGEIVGVIGPNGAGKTTLFDVISGFVRPDSGTVSYRGRPLDGLGADDRARLGLGRSFQNVRLFPALTVRENVAVARERRMASENPVLAAMWAPVVREAERRVFKRVDALLELLGLERFADKFADELSTGTRRALDVACIVASEPELVLLDEPSSGLAQRETAELGLLLARVAREMDCAMVVIEHDLALVSSLAHRLVAMHLGAVVTTGLPSDVLEDPRVVETYLSGSGDGAPAPGDHLEGVLAAVLGSRRA